MITGNDDFSGSGMSHDVLVIVVENLRGRVEALQEGHVTVIEWLRDLVKDVDILSARVQTLEQKVAALVRMQDTIMEFQNQPFQDLKERVGDLEGTVAELERRMEIFSRYGPIRVTKEKSTEIRDPTPGQRGFPPAPPLERPPPFRADIGYTSESPT